MLALYAAGAVAWGVRDAVAAWHLSHPTLASWQRQRFQIRRCAHPQRVLMTGATRFIGRIVARRLVEHGHIVVVLDRNRAIGSGPGFAFHIDITLPECGLLIPYRGWVQPH